MTSAELDSYCSIPPHRRSKQSKFAQRAVHARARSCLRSGGHLGFRLHHGDELVEADVRVVGSGRGLGMVLNGQRLHLWPPHASARACTRNATVSQARIPPSVLWQRTERSQHNSVHKQQRPSVCRRDRHRLLGCTKHAQEYQTYRVTVARNQSHRAKYKYEVSAQSTSGNGK